MVCTTDILLVPDPHNAQLMRELSVLHPTNYVPMKQIPIHPQYPDAAACGGQASMHADNINQADGQVTTLQSFMKPFLALSLPLLLSASAFAGGFTSGNLVVVRVANGVGLLNNQSTPVYLDEYTPGGTLVQTISLPTNTSGTNLALTLTGNGVNEGYLELSGNGQFLTLGGYNIAPGTATPSTAAASATPRTIGLIKLSNGSVDTTTAINSGTSGNIRSAATLDGTSFWASSSGASVGYFTYGAPTAATQLSAAPSNIRVTRILNNQLYVSSANPIPPLLGLGTLGTGVPTTSGQTTTELTGFPTTSGPSSYDFFVSGNSAWVCDDRSNGNGGIQKWTLSGGTWSLQYTIAQSATVGARGLAVDTSTLSGTPTFYVTSTANTIDKVVDGGTLGSSSDTILVTGVSSGTGTGAFRGIALYGSSTYPQVSLIPNQSLTNTATSTPALPFTVTSPITYATNIGVSAVSDNPIVVPNNPSHIAMTSDAGGTNHTITITAAAVGSATITVTATNAGLASSVSFLVTVGAPSFVILPSDQLISTNGTTAVQPITLFSPQDSSYLNLYAESAYPSIVANAGLTLTRISSTRYTLQASPVADTNGWARIFVHAVDTNAVPPFTNTVSFAVVVYPHPGPVLSDNFSYADGSIVDQSGGFWTAISAPLSNDLYIVSNQAQIAYTNYTDVSATLSIPGAGCSTAIFSTGSTNSSGCPNVLGGGVLYSKYTVNCAVLPHGNGTYFGAFVDGGTGNNYRCRIFAVTNGAASGHYRLGIAQGANLPSAIYPQDLDPGTAYTVVTRYVVATTDSALWINPGYQSDLHVTAADNTTALSMQSYAFRQGFGVNGTNDNSGVLYLASLVIGTAFTDVVPYAPVPSPTLNISWSGNNVVLTWSDARFSVYSSPVPVGPKSSWTPVPGTSPLTITPGASQQYYGLHGTFSN